MRTCVHTCYAYIYHSAPKYSGRLYTTIQPKSSLYPGTEWDVLPCCAVPVPAQQTPPRTPVLIPEKAQAANSMRVLVLVFNTAPYVFTLLWANLLVETWYMLLYVTLTAVGLQAHAAIREHLRFSGDLQMMSSPPVTQTNPTVEKDGKCVCVPSLQTVLSPPVDIHHNFCSCCGVCPDSSILERNKLCGHAITTHASYYSETLLGSKQSRQCSAMSSYWTRQQSMKWRNIRRCNLMNR